jgi:hypothetical protein
MLFSPGSKLIHGSVTVSKIEQIGLSLVNRQFIPYVIPVRSEGNSKPERTSGTMFHIFSVHVVSLCIAFLSIVAVYVYIFFVSDYAFWFMFAAYVMLASDRGK